MDFRLCGELVPLPPTLFKGIVRFSQEEKSSLTIHLPQYSTCPHDAPSTLRPLGGHFPPTPQALGLAVYKAPSPIPAPRLHTAVGSSLFGEPLESLSQSSPHSGVHHPSTCPLCGGGPRSTVLCLCPSLLWVPILPRQMAPTALGTERPRSRLDPDPAPAHRNFQLPQDSSQGNCPSQHASDLPPTH